MLTVTVGMCAKKGSSRQVLAIQSCNLHNLLHYSPTRSRTEHRTSIRYEKEAAETTGGNIARSWRRSDDESTLPALDGGPSPSVSIHTGQHRSTPDKKERERERKGAEGSIS